MYRLKSILMVLLCSASISTFAGSFKVNGVEIGDSSAIQYITANYEARVIKIVTDGTAHFSIIDDTVDLPGETQQRLIVDDVVIGSSDLITWFLINPGNDNVRLLTNGNLDITVDKPARDPKISLFKANKATITAGDTVTLNWTTTDVDYCQAGDDFNVSGDLIPDADGAGSESFVESVEGSRNYKLTCFAEEGSDIFETSSSVTITVEPADIVGNGNPGIQSFTASSATISAGEPLTLSWQANNVNFCQGTVDFDLGSQTQSLPINSSLTFTETREGVRTYGIKCLGSQNYTKTINVQVVSGNGGGSSPAIRSFSTSNPSPAVNQVFALSWDAINVDSCVASGSWSGAKSVTGSANISYPTVGNRSFTLDCTETATGTVVSRTVNVSVGSEPVGNGLQITSFTATPNPVQVGDAVTLKWVTANAISCGAESPGMNNWLGGLPANGSRVIDINQAGDITFVIRCYDKVDTSISITSSVIMSTTGVAQQPVTTQLTVSNNSIVEGEVVTFNWASFNATSCVTDGIAPGWAGTSLSTSGSMQFTPRHDSMSYTYGVTCSNSTSSDTGLVGIFVALPAQTLGTNGCAVPFATNRIREWDTTWDVAWPGPAGTQRTISLNHGENLSLHFLTGQTGVSASLSSVPHISTLSVRTATITECPGDFTFGRFGANQPGQPMDPDCTHTWGEGGNMNYIVDDNYVPNNGVCELSTNKDYYLNIRFSSACTGNTCAGIFKYTQQ